jgi:hypothetical protein
MEVVLPDGIAPADVTYVSGPRGWKLTRTADGYTVGGPAVDVGEEFTYKVRITQLPADATSLSFKTLQRYSDGDLDRWIEIPKEGSPEPDNPAPTLALAPAATTAPPATTPPATTGPAGTGSAIAPAAQSGGGSLGWLWLVFVVVLVAAVGALLWSRRRGAGASGPPST